MQAVLLEQIHITVPVYLQGGRETSVHAHEYTLRQYPCTYYTDNKNAIILLWLNNTTKQDRIAVVLFCRPHMI